MRREEVPGRSAHAGKVREAGRSPPVCQRRTAADAGERRQPRRSRSLSRDHSRPRERGRGRSRSQEHRRRSRSREQQQGPQWGGTGGRGRFAAPPHHAPGSAIQLNKQLVQARDVAGVLALMRNHGNEMNAVNASTALHQLAKRSKRERIPSDAVAEASALVARHLPDFKPQNLANSLWAWATLGHSPGEATLGRFAEAAERQLAGFKVFPLSLKQLFQAKLLWEEMGVAWEMPRVLYEEADAVWRAEAQRVTVSALQRAVGAVLHDELGVEYELEAQTADGLFSIDIAVRAESVALEVDGPSHFVCNTRAPTGRTLARNRLLAARGWRVVALPFFEWDACGGDRQRQAECLRRHLRGLLAQLES